MSAHLGAWLSLALRWAHVIVGVSWIGTSFYFNWLNARLVPPTRAEPGVSGELWSVHGGGFYRVVKYGVAPGRLPATLHWFKWEAYATWWTGLSLLVLIYFVGAREYLLDPAVSPLTPAAGITIGVATLVAAWLVYDALCRSPLGARPATFAAAGLLLITALAWGLSHLLSARAAYLHVGAALGTIMAANVFRVIIPSQRAMVASLVAGRTPDARSGGQAALRSVHNNYLTLPVLFVMVSSHYPATYGASWGWGILGALFVIGVLVRHWFNLRNAGRRNRWLLPAAALGLIALAVATAPRGGGARPGDGSPAQFAGVRVVIAQRCAPCHSRAPTYPGIPAAPAGVLLDTPTEIRATAQRILERAVTTKTMPLGNLTGITDAERDELRRWIAAGAPLH